MKTCHDTLQSLLMVSEVSGQSYPGEQLHLVRQGKRGGEGKGEGEREGVDAG